MTILIRCIVHAFQQPLAEMSVSSILEFWGLREDIPCQWLFVPGNQERYDWCFVQAKKGLNQGFPRLFSARNKQEHRAQQSVHCPAPSITSQPTQHKRTKKELSDCPFAIQERRAEMGAKTVQHQLNRQSHHKNCATQACSPCRDATIYNYNINQNHTILSNKRYIRARIF